MPDHNDPIQTIPPPYHWCSGAYLITLEPLTPSRSICVVHAARERRTGDPFADYDSPWHSGTVIMQAPPTLDLSASQPWAPAPAALERAVRRAIRECETEHDTKEKK